MIGLQSLLRRKGRLHFILLAEDASENTCKEVLSEFRTLPIIRRYSSTDMLNLLGARSAQVVGFLKSSLAQSLYNELKQFRLNQPSVPGTR